MMSIFKNIRSKTNFKRFFLTLLSLLLVVLICLKIYHVFSFSEEKTETYIIAKIDLPKIKAPQSLKPAPTDLNKFPYALPKAPNPLLVQNAYEGYLPKISPDGLTASQYYAAPFNAKAYKGIIPIAVGPFELDEATIYPKIDALTHQISLVFSPYTQNLQKIIDYARKRGHEVYLTVPLESLTFPTNDSGPDTLMIDYSEKTNLNQLNIIFGKATGYVGLINLDGGRFVSYEMQMRFFLSVLKKRGLTFIDASKNLRSLTTVLSKQLEAVPLRIKQNSMFSHLINEKALLKNLDKLAAFAKYNKKAIAIFNATPVTIESLAKWQLTKPDDISFAPLSESFLPKILEETHPKTPQESDH